MTIRSFLIALFVSFVLFGCGSAIVGADVDDATPQDLFRELAGTGAQVERFAVQAPSLDEVFIRTVAGDPRAEAVR